jgi:hypothetical protein
MNKQSFKGKIAKSVLVSCILIGFVSGLVIVSNMNPSEIISSVGQRGWKNIASADATLASSESGFLCFMTYPHQATPLVAYAENLSNSSLTGGAYEFLDSLNGEMTNETPYNTAFDFVLKFQVNDTVGYNVSKWMDSWVRANITVDFDFIADVGPLASMTIVQIWNCTDYAVYQAYINNGGSGYSLGKNEKFNCTTIQAEGYW